ncbi:pentapeptide repeat-containing protein [Escherichia coli]|nr:pentapeptide repeat-containing protein [Escherichia coli]
MTEKGPAGCTLRIDFKIKNEPVGNTEHSFTNSDTMKTRNGDNQLINNNDNNNKLIRQILESAVRNGIDLHDISLENISLAGPRLEHARLRNARLAHISLVQAVLYHADLRHADLRHADLRYADLRHADLRHADLRHADLRHADLRYADLRRADLGGVNNLHGPQLTFARMKAAMYNNVPLTHGNIGTYFPDVFPQFISWR